jgi:hypothetical protein
MNSNANASLAEAPFGSVYKVVLSTVTDFMRTKKMARMFGRIKSNRFALAINKQIKEQSYFFFHHISSPNHVQSRAGLQKTTVYCLCLCEDNLDGLYQCLLPHKNPIIF